MTRGLLHLVVKLIEQSGPASVDDLMPKIAGKTRKQVLAALANARSTGRLVLATRRPRIGRGIGVGAGSYPAIYSLPSETGPIVRPKATGRTPSSVFELANYV